MRVVAGRYGGRRLSVPKGRDIRPTSDKVRGAVFNALESLGVVDGAFFMDVFCGTGALGIEALSRGAHSGMFCDKDAISLKLARINVESVVDQEVASNLTFIMKAANRLAQKSDDMPSVNLVFLDPPYGRGLAIPALMHIYHQGWLAPEAVIVMETERSLSESIPPEFEMLKEKIYGDTAVRFLSLKHAAID